MAIEMCRESEGFSQAQREMLTASLDVNVIKHRPGGNGKMLKYIKGDTAIDTANRIFGYGHWGYKVIGRSHEVIEDEKKGRMEFYTADIELSVVGAAFPFPGDGVGIVNAPYTVEMHEKGRKEATTDALKRALRHYGDQFGLCLYDEDDYVEAADGTRMRVGDVKPNNAPAAKRVVDAHTQQHQQLPSSNSPTPKPDDAVKKQRLNALYLRAVGVGEIARGSSAEKFLEKISEILKVKITVSGHLTSSRLDMVEAYLEQCEKKKPQLEVVR